jgi:hypothetical protein
VLVVVVGARVLVVVVGARVVVVVVAHLGAAMTSATMVSAQRAAPTRTYNANLMPPYQSSTLIGCARKRNTTTDMQVK